MTTLEDKILGEKAHCYCSSSSGSEGEESDEEKDETCVQEASREPEVRPYKWEGTSTNTGPKGVLRDWERFKEEERGAGAARRLEADCRPQDEAEDLGSLLEEAFLDEYRRRRMREMLAATAVPRFGAVVDLRSTGDFLDAIDKEDRRVTIVIHIYESGLAACRIMNECLTSLASGYPHVKFCKLLGSSAGMSHRFKMDGVPALLVYKGGQVIGNFVRVTDDLGEDFYQGDVENFLIEHGIIFDRACVPPIDQP